MSDPDDRTTSAWASPRYAHTARPVYGNAEPDVPQRRVPLDVAALAAYTAGIKKPRPDCSQARQEQNSYQKGTT